MQLEVGTILEGKVTGITNFGVFVEIEKGTTGMVHISEIATSYVNEIRDHVKENDIVKVKVLQLNDNGKISLSIKRAIERPMRTTRVQPQAHPSSKPMSHTNNFEDMMTKFKQLSDEKFLDLKRKNGDTKRARKVKSK